MFPKLLRFSTNYHDKLSIFLVIILFVFSWKAILLFLFEFRLHPIVLIKIVVVHAIFIVATLIVVKLVEIGIKKAYEKLNTEIRRQCFINLLVGLGLSCLASMIPRILMYQIQYKQGSHGGFGLVTLNFLPAVVFPYYLFVFQSKVKCQSINTVKDVVSWIIGIINFVVVFKTIDFTLEYNDIGSFQILTFELGLAAFTGSTMIEFVSVARRGVEMQVGMEEGISNVSYHRDDDEELITESGNGEADLRAV